MPKMRTIQKRRPASGVMRLILEEDGQKAHDDGEEGGAFDHTGGNDHRRTQVSGAFRLAGYRLLGGLADFTNAEGCSDGCYGSSDGSSRLAEGGTHGNLEKDG